MRRSTALQTDALPSRRSASAFPTPISSLLPQPPVLPLSRRCTQHKQNGRVSYTHVRARVASLARPRSRTRSPAPVLPMHLLARTHPPGRLPLPDLHASRLLHAPARHLQRVLDRMPHRPRAARALPQTRLPVRLPDARARACVHAARRRRGAEHRERVRPQLRCRVLQMRVPVRRGEGARDDDPVRRV